MMLERSSDDDKEVDEQNEPTGLFGDITDIWPNHHPDIEDTVIIPGVAEFINHRNLPYILNDILYSEIRTADMANLGNMLLGYPVDVDPMHDDSKMGRLSLAHERLSYVPRAVCDEFGPYVKILDICDNEIKNLDFLEYFTELTTLIADKNPINVTDTNIPWMPKLELLYLNRCKLSQPFWIETLRYNCPNLKFLSLMGNPIAPSIFNGGNIYEYLRYRLYVISLIPSLIHLDDKRITDEERLQAKRMFPRPIVQNFLKSTKVRFPRYLRRLTGRMNNYFTSNATRTGGDQKNLVI